MIMETEEKIALDMLLWQVAERIDGSLAADILAADDAAVTADVMEDGEEANSTAVRLRVAFVIAAAKLASENGDDQG